MKKNRAPERKFKEREREALSASAVLKMDCKPEAPSVKINLKKLFGTEGK